MVRHQHLLISLFVIISIILSSSSCKKEDNVNDPGSSSGTGSIEFDGKSYSIKYGLYDYFGEFGGVHNFELFLFSDGVNLNNETGEGNVISIYFYSDVPPLPTGTIPYYSGTDDIPYIEAQAGLDYNLETQVGKVIPVFQEGNVTITRSGDTYNIEFTLISETEGQMTGNYKGKVSAF